MSKIDPVIRNTAHWKVDPVDPSLIPMIPRRRPFSDISEDVITEHKKRQRSEKNTYFDQMIRSMSAVRQRKESSDAYSPSKSTTLASDLSFVKKTNTDRSSSASKVYLENSTRITKS